MKFDVQNAQRRLLGLAARHASELSKAVDVANDAAERAYEHAAGLVADDKERALSTLKSSLAAVVQSAREHADDLAVAHVLAELRAAVGAGANQVTLVLPRSPSPADVAKYVDNCVDAAREATSETATGEAFRSTLYRGKTVVESEMTSRYTVAREAALKSLRSLSDAQTRKLGFAVARKESEFRTSDSFELREDEGKTTLIPLVGMRWCASSNPCSRCAAVHGQLRPFGFAFGEPGPTAHARCRCITTLWVLPLQVERAAAEVTTTMQEQANPHGGKTQTRDLAYHQRSLDLREAKFDRENMTIKGCVASDESEDSHGSVILAKGWDLSRYEKNPVLLWNHAASRYSKPAEPEDVLGNTEARVQSKRLIVDLAFLKSNPKAVQVFEAMEAGAIRALSVGFTPLEYHFEKRGEGGDELLVIDRALLVEVSVLPIGSNQNALSRELLSMCARETCECESSGCSAVGHTADAGAEQTRNQPTAERNEDMDVNENKAVALPPSLAARLNVDSVEKAVSEIDKRDLQLDKLTKDLAAVTADRDALKSTIEKREAEDAAAEVDALISAGRVSADKRDAALRSYKADREAFRTLYPPQAAAPLEKLVAPLNLPAERSAPTKPVESSVNPIVTRASALQKEGAAYEAAWSRALNEYQAGKLNPDGSVCA